MIKKLPVRTGGAVSIPLQTSMRDARSVKIQVWIPNFNASKPVTWTGSETPISCHCRAETVVARHKCDQWQLSPEEVKSSPASGRNYIPTERHLKRVPQEDPPEGPGPYIMWGAGGCTAWHWGSFISGRHAAGFALCRVWSGGPCRRQVGGTAILYHHSRGGVLSYKNWVSKWQFWKVRSRCPCSWAAAA